MESRSSYDCSDPAALGELYRKLRPLAVSKTQYLTSHSLVAQDIVQDVFERLWQKSLLFPSIAAAYSWVYAACHNAAIDYLRGQRRMMRHQRELLNEEPRTVASAADRMANRDLLLEILNHLSDREAQILAYQIVDGLSQKEIADLLQISEKTVQRDNLAVKRKVEAIRRMEYA